MFKLGRIILKTLILCICFWSVAYAGKLEIINYSAQCLEKALSVNLQWQSENPIIKVRIFAGQGQKDVVIDEYDNRRNPYGYSGELSVVVPMELSLFQEYVPFQIQIEDDLRQKSTLISGSEGAVRPPRERKSC